MHQQKQIESVQINKLRKITSSFHNILKRYFSLEGLIWISALVYLAFFVNPYETHFSFCLLSKAGVDNCPGCGLGNSISLLLNGKIMQSINTHILGIPAIILLCVRIISITKFNSNVYKKLNLEERIQDA